MALLEISIVPVGTDDPSFSSYVAEACREAERNGIKYEVTPTSTVLEGDLPALMHVAQQMHDAGFRGGSQRVVTNISIDERRDKDLTMEKSVETVHKEM
jgi:uncharacterized protein (TIGR00106 family)